MQIFRRQNDKGAPAGSIREAGGDAIQVVIDYFKQETLGPLRGLVRFLIFGIAGSVLLVTGLALLLVGLLRALQSETGTTFSGNLTWVPYGCVAAAALLLMGLAAWRITRGPASRRQSSQDGSVTNGTDRRAR